MGLVFQDICNLLNARRGRCGGSAIMLGRLDIYLHASEITSLRALIKDDPLIQEWVENFTWAQPADDFFKKALKFETIESIDISDYQGASIIHDLGQPLPPHLIANYDLAVDGGTLEHVFNFPQALLNFMHLVRADGLLYWHGPCNNLCGHGFYQFSPELAFRIFCRPNGFKLHYVRLLTSKNVSIEISSRHEVYEVKDPLAAGCRVNLVTSMPVSIMVLSQRDEVFEPFTKNVLQSDYVTTWSGEIEPYASNILDKIISHYLPRSWRLHLRAFWESRRASLRCKKMFVRLR